MFNHTLDSLNESFTIAFADRVRRLKAQGVPVIGLQTGDPDFQTPAPIIEAANRAMLAGETHYSNSRGLDELRQAISAHIERRYAVAYDAEREILVTHGAVHGYHCALHALLNRGDEVLIADPSWQTHANMVRLLGGVPIRITTRADAQFLPDIADFEAAITAKTRAIIINYPNNPTGVLPERDFFTRLNQLAIAHHLFVVSDEVYDRLVYEGHEHTCFASLPDAKAHTIVINSFSKSYAMTGWRVGYVLAPDWLIEQMLKVSQHTITNLAPFIQRGALTALTDTDVAQTVEHMLTSYARRRTLVMNLSDNFPDGLRFTAPAGAFYFFIDARSLGLSSVELSERILTEAHVALVPGSVYGDFGEGYLRMTIAASEDEIAQGMQSLSDWLARF
ncbi:MAG: pyridoxal phosphate-dependent aminotransferase [Anaerolineae bacterium]